MSGDSLSDSTRSSAVNLVRSSHQWTEADNAAGFVLRYLTPMRRQLETMLGSNRRADEALKLLIVHLVAAGFGEHKQGRLRDFLLRAIRSASKNLIGEMVEHERSQFQIGSLDLESKQWVAYWREGLLERAWRSLERQQHADPDRPVFSVLHCATSNPTATPAMLADQLASSADARVDEATIEPTLAEARTLFAQLIADEVAETLQDPQGDDVKREINRLGLGKAFDGVSLEVDDEGTGD